MKHTIFLTVQVYLSNLQEAYQRHIDKHQKLKLHNFQTKNARNFPIFFSFLISNFFLEDSPHVHSLYAQSIQKNYIFL